MPVDLYVGGAEHAVLHLLYARFWHKVLYDRGHVSTAEPFQRLVNQGMILGEVEYTGYQTGRRPVGQRGSTSARTPTGRTDRQADRASRCRKCRVDAEAGRETGRRRSCWRSDPEHPRRQPRLQDVEESRQRGESGRDRARVRCRRAAAVRNVHGAAGSHQAVEHGRRAAACASFWTGPGG